MKKRLHIILALALSCVFASCEDFLTEKPRHSWEMDSALSSYQNLQQVVNGAYGILAEGDYPNQGTFCNLTCMSGMMHFYEHDYMMDWTTENVSFWNTGWDKMYKVINTLNMAINGADMVPESSYPSEQAKTELLGEARFLRGYVYAQIMFLHCCWWDKDESPYGLIYRDQVADANNLQVPRISVGESWTRIMEDIDYGIANMPEFSSNRRVSPIFAKAFKAKILLRRGSIRNTDADIQEAKALIDDCLANIPAGIAINPDMKNHFDLSWDSNENIFCRYLESNSDRERTAGYWSYYGISLYAYTDYVDRKGNVVPQKDAVCGLEYGLDWMREDPRFYIQTSKERNAEAWDDSYVWTWSKIYRRGAYVGEMTGDQNWTVYYMRLPELYILQAELRMRTGAAWAEVLAPINEMRSKRTNPVLPAVEVPATEQEMWDIIFQEYCKEMLLENGTEFFASIRIPKDNGNYMQAIKGEDFKFDITRLQKPIPSEEMQNNKTIAGMQNPGQE